MTSEDFRSYYGRPVIKEPTWKVPDVPAYLYLGGLAGGCSVMAAVADLTGDRKLCRAGRITAAAGATVSVAALVHDLGRPERFLNMLRVLKPTSPLNIGSWILAPFSALSGLAAASEVTGKLPVLGRLCASTAGVIAPAMTTYTAVLLADTAVPTWHASYRHLPFMFAGSALSSAGAAGMMFVPVREARPARRIALAGSALEIATHARMVAQTGLEGQPYRYGRGGTALRIARGLTWAGMGTALLAKRSRAAAIAAGLCLSAGAVASRYGVFEAGRTSARDPKYTVVPQRERKDAAARQ